MVKYVSAHTLTSTLQNVVRPPAESKEQIALRVSLHLPRPERAPAASALSPNALSPGALLLRGDDDDRGTSRPSLCGKGVGGTVAPGGRHRGRKPLPKSIPTPSEARLLALLDRPRRGTELAPLLGVTRQRVNQMIVTLLEREFIRPADPENRTSIIALRDDPSPLLRLEQERLLSRFPDGEATTLSRIVNLTHTPKEKIASIADSLCKTGLIEKTAVSPLGDLYRLTVEGAGHWQRSVSVIRANAPSPPRLPVRSERIRSVLADLESHGTARTRDIGLRLGLPQPTINALMQYLKRKRMVRTESDARWAPYVLTADGRQTLAVMLRQATSPLPGG